MLAARIISGGIQSLVVSLLCSALLYSSLYSMGKQMEVVIPATVLDSLPDQGWGHMKPCGEQSPFV